MTKYPPQLVIGDPHDQPGLVDRIPAGAGPIQIVNYYHYPLYPRHKAYCAKCHARRHRDGFTIELDNGTLALAGSKCGSELWGERWKAVRKAYESKLHREGIILDVKTVLSELVSIRATLEADWRPVVRQLHLHKLEFMTGPMASFYKKLRAIDHTGIEGWAYFEMDSALKEFELALSQIDAAIDAGHGQETKLGVRTVNIGDARNRLDAIAHVARGLRNFFAQEGRSCTHAVWAVNDLIGWSRYDVDANGRRIVDNYTQASIGLPHNYPVLNTEALRKLRDMKSTV